MIRTLIFDLDDYLAPASTVGEKLYEPAFEAMREKNQGALSQSTLEQAFDDIGHHPLDWVAERYGFPEEVRDADSFVQSRIELPRIIRNH
ncbi:hypothetical protein [Pelagicoccus mobilis]|uniref:Haloacid dehalogenase n=1 Tax=Pelagicoccus mobilis TaxID=415221 RepID=A0A934S362_9BACT|nr:hypothetical protein [Pelagicoccus mobilis]MBK1878967.1 hypothetical protein [Pelagicoccus mobilis]